MKKADKKVREYLERAKNIFGDDYYSEDWRDYSYKTSRGINKYILKPRFIIEIAKMIQREEHEKMLNLIKDILKFKIKKQKGYWLEITKDGKEVYGWPMPDLTILKEPIKVYINEYKGWLNITTTFEKGKNENL